MGWAAPEGTEMSLTAVKPPQELLDGLSLDAAWERAQDLEREVIRLRAMLKTTNENYTDLATRYGKVVNGVWAVAGKHPELLAELQALID
jgi:hypothetical protein